MFTLIECTFEDIQGQNIVCRFGDRELEGCFELLTELAQAGNRLLTVRCCTGDGFYRLPASAFDGKPMTEALRSLRRQWEACLLVSDQ